ncbi:MAG TPA: hypothetical protein GXX67_12730 [Petrimonas sp.]|nr:hypothetical protein [Petrimonas sp.]
MKNDAGFLNRHNVDITINMGNMGIFDGPYTFVYDDVCIDCRTKIGDATSKKIAMLINANTHTNQT